MFSTAQKKSAKGDNSFITLKNHLTLSISQLLVFVQCQHVLIAVINHNFINTQLNIINFNKQVHWK